MSALYLDTSALFKRYVEEEESEAVIARTNDALLIGTAMITRVEVAAAPAKAVRDNRMGLQEAREVEHAFVGACIDQDLRRAATAEGLLAWPA